MTQSAVPAGTSVPAGLIMPDWSKGRGQTKSSPWSSRLGIGQWAKNLLLENLKFIFTEMETSEATLPYCAEAETYIISTAQNRVRWRVGGPMFH